MSAVKTSIAADLDNGEDGYDPFEALHAHGYAAGIRGTSLALCLEQAHATTAAEFSAVICGYGEGTRDLTTYRLDLDAGLDLPQDPFA